MVDDHEYDPFKPLKLRLRRLRGLYSWMVLHTRNCHPDFKPCFLLHEAIPCCSIPTHLHKHLSCQFCVTPALKHSPVVSQRFVFMESSSSCAGMSWTSPSSVCQTSSQWCICGTWKGTSPYPERWRNVAASMSEGCATVEHIKSWYGQLLLQSSKRMRVLGFVKWLTGSPGTRKGLCNREQLVIVASVTINLEWEEKTKKNRWFLNKCLPSLTLHFSSSFFYRLLKGNSIPAAQWP